MSISLVWLADTPSYIPPKLKEYVTKGYSESEKLSARCAYVHFRKIDKKFLDIHPNLEYVLCPCTGIDHIDEREMTLHNTQLIYLDSVFKETVGKSVTSTAEHTIRLLLNISKGHSLHKKRIVIIGYGRIGKMVAQTCLSFGMKVSAYEKPTTKYQLKKALGESEYVSIHLPGTEVDFFDEEMFGAMRPGSFLINTARAKIVNKKALIEALDFLGGYAVDFHDKELEQFHNVIMTNHVGGNTIESRILTDKYVFGQYIDVLGNTI